ncbi:hypothetical protein JHD50_12910 [Sulfurimonas sp. MAG313]|nr:hypothetical protein [Sulfurimonas sp. MAG313]MDF1882188.1 hypothetical protein [Sulfurimonas sp. MAG313]
MSHNKIVFSVGLFILSISILILISLVYVIEKKGIFEVHKKYQLISKNGENIDKGMPILFSGFEIAQVNELALDDNGEVLITISVAKHNLKWLRRNSQFILEKPLIGTAIIVLKSDMAQPALNEKVISRLHIKDGINEIISNVQPLILDLHSIVTNINTLSHSLADKNASFQSSLNHIQTLSSKLASSPSLLDSLTGDKQSSLLLHEVIRNLNRTLIDMQGIIKNANHSISSSQKNIIEPASSGIKEMDLILKDVHKKLRNMDKLVTNISNSHTEIQYFKDEMKVLLDEMKEISTKVNSIIGEEGSQDVELP